MFITEHGTVDFTEEYKKVSQASAILKAEARGSDVLILRHIGARLALNGIRYAYQVEYRWLSKEITCQKDVDDQNYLCAKGQDWQLCPWREAKAYIHKSLFDMFQLF